VKLFRQNNHVQGLEVFCWLSNLSLFQPTDHQIVAHDPSCNTDQGVHYTRKCTGRKPERGINVIKLQFDLIYDRSYAKLALL